MGPDRPILRVREAWHHGGQPGCVSRFDCPRPAHPAICIAVFGAESATYPVAKRQPSPPPRAVHAADWEAGGLAAASASPYLNLNAPAPGSGPALTVAAAVVYCTLPASIRNRQRPSSCRKGQSISPITPFSGPTVWLPGPARFRDGPAGTGGGGHGPAQRRCTAGSPRLRAGNVNG